MVRRVIVGAHYGLKDWFVQRVSAVIMALYTLLWVAIGVVQGGVDYALWRQLFASGAFRVATLLFWLALIWHAWVGMRDIWMDYLKPTALRLWFEALTALTLLAYALWLIDLLWGPR